MLFNNMVLDISSGSSCMVLSPDLLHATQAPLQ